MTVQERDQAYIAATYARYGIVLTEGTGSVLFDQNGKKYIDLGSGIAVNTFGVSDEKWIKAVKGQLVRLNHTSNLYYTEPQTRLAEMLCQKTGMKKVFFSNSGAEANECAIKAARKYSSDRYGKERNTIVTLKNSFHGRTITTLAATGQELFHRDYEPFTEGFIYVEPNQIEDLKEAIQKNSCCAIMMELIQGEGGVIVLDKEYVKAAAKLAENQDILLIIDEVQTGNGRTGKLYCYMNYEITPDIVSTAKGLGGGLPIGATLFGEKTKEVLQIGDHGSTFGGNPICAAGACNIIERLDSPLMEEIAKKSRYIWQQLEGIKGVKSLSGMGFLIGIETEKDGKEIVEKCLEKGVLVLTAKKKIRLLPPLNIPWTELMEAVEILKEVIHT